MCFQVEYYEFNVTACALCIEAGGKCNLCYETATGDTITEPCKCAGIRLYGAWNFKEHQHPWTQVPDPTTDQWVQ